MKIVFIKPNMIAGTPSDSMEPLVFALLAGMTPAQHECRFFDERLEKIPLNIEADLVALTADVFSAKRAYQIASIFRRKNIPVVIGGYHPSLCPEEAAQYVDSVVVGDAEDTWPQILADTEAGKLQAKYVSEAPDFGLITPDRSIFKGKKYAPVTMVEFNRGCRYSCDFCSIRAMYKSQVRRKCPKNVIRDIGPDSKHIFFTDDNLYADKNALAELLKQLELRKLKWSCQISSDIIKYPEIVAAMAQAGCTSVTIGFETLERENLQQMGKNWMEKDYSEIIKVFHDHGIMVYGTFIIGYEHDIPEVFEQILAFVLENRLFLANFNPLIPTPGTPLYSRLQEKNRLLFEHWWLDDSYRWGDCVFQPMNMSPEDLAEGCYQVRKAFNSIKNIWIRFPGLRLNRTSLYKTGIYLMANLVSRRELKRKYGQALGDQETKLQKVG